MKTKFAVLVISLAIGGGLRAANERDATFYSGAYAHPKIPPPQHLGAPIPVVITDINGNTLAVTGISGSASGQKTGNPTPVVLTDSNGNVLTLSGGGVTQGQPAILGASGLPDTAHLLALNMMMDGSGNPTDSSGNGNICTLAAGGAAPIWNTAASGGGLVFTGSSHQFCSYPAAVNAAQTFIVAMNFQPQNLYNQYVYNSVQILAGSSGIGTSVGWDLVNSYLTDAWGPASQESYKLRSQNVNATAWSASSLCTFAGTGVAAWTLGVATNDQFYINGTQCGIFYSYFPTGQQQTTGVIQLGGSNVYANTNYFTGTIYAFAAWSTVLTAAQVAQASESLQHNLIERGVQGQLMNPGTDHFGVAIIDGDSLTSYQSWPVQGLQPCFYYAMNSAKSGSTLDGLNAVASLSIDPNFHPGATCNVSVIWAGTNGSGVGALEAGKMANYCRQRKAVGWKCVGGTMVSRTGLDAAKNNVDSVLRQSWPLWADGLIDFAANVHFGCDGCNTNATYFLSDHIHPTGLSDIIIMNYYVHGINRAVGNLGPSSNYNIYSGTGTTVPNVLQTVDCTGLSGATVTCAFPFNQSAASLLVANVFCRNCTGATFPTTPTDTQTDTWQAITATSFFSGGSGYLRAYYAMNSGAGANTVSFTFTGTAPSNITISMQEVSGILTSGALDVSSPIASGSSSTPTAASITTTVSGDFLWAYGAYVNISSNTGALAFQQTSWIPGLLATTTVPFSTLNNFLDVGTLGATAVSAGSYVASAQTTWGIIGWGFGAAAFKPITASTSTYQLQDVDVYSECNPAGGNTALILPDGAWMMGGTVTVKNVQSSGANTCIVNAPTPYAQGVQQTIDGATSVTIANKATAVFKAKFSYTGVLNTNMVPVVTWELLQNN